MNFYPTSIVCLYPQSPIPVSYDPSDDSFGINSELHCLFLDCVLITDIRFPINVSTPLNTMLFIDFLSVSLDFNGQHQGRK